MIFPFTLFDRYVSHQTCHYHHLMGLFPDTQNCGLRMSRECRERFSRHRRQRKTLVSDTGMHHGTCATHVPWCISGSLTCGGGEKRSRNFAYLSRAPWHHQRWCSETPKTMCCIIAPFWGIEVTYKSHPHIDAYIAELVHYYWNNDLPVWHQARI